MYDFSPFFLTCIKTIFKKYLEVKTKLWKTYQSVTDLNDDISNAKPGQRKRKVEFLNNESVEVTTYFILRTKPCFEPYRCHSAMRPLIMVWTRFYLLECNNLYSFIQARWNSFDIRTAVSYEGRRTQKIISKNIRTVFLRLAMERV